MRSISQTIGRCKILRVTGRIDFEAASDFEKSLGDLIQESQPVILDLSEVEMLSSAGLRVILTAGKRASQRKGELVLAAPGTAARQVIEVSHFNLLFRIFQTLDEAVAAFGESAASVLIPAQGMPIAQTIGSPLLPETAVQSAIHEPTQDPLPVAASETRERPAEPNARSETLSSAGSLQNEEKLERLPITYPADLELRAEGVSYPCKDGDVIGKAGALASDYFSKMGSLDARHVLIGREDEKWFLFTPKTVLHPFVLDGQPLEPGERKFLCYFEHQIEFEGHIFGLRFVPEQPRKGVLSRLFGSKSRNNKAL
ncbi:MAG: anti-sigma factor antagonist [Verrucomicrobia bacterium]|nr:anti-sigma factor antagonist [Verrucomicrobiota bacterium]